MAPKGRSVSKTARIVALGISAKTEIETAADLIGDCRSALKQWADELSTEPENARQSAAGIQAEAIRLTMSALSVRAAAERLAVVAQLADDVAGAGGAS